MPQILPRFTPLVPMVVLGLLLSACDKKATGQVAAVVNGDEITLQQVNAELSAVKLPDGAEKDKAKAAVLQSLVDKQLLEQQAKTAGLDRDPDYLMRQRQLDQALLLQFYARKAQDTIRLPDQATVTKFIADNPDTFANRIIFSVDQLRFAPTRDSTLLPSLRNLHSLESVASFLTSKGVPFERGKGKVDSAQVPPTVVKQVLGLPSGEPFVVPSAQGIVVNVVTGRTPAPLPALQAQPAAVQMIRSKAMETLIQQRLKDAKGQAKITYQPGFEPKPTANSSGLKK